MTSLPPADCDELLGLFLSHEIADRIQKQAEFFSIARPTQAVLEPGWDASTVKEIVKNIQAIWARHGWPKLGTKILPPTRELAGRIERDVLLGLYDYLFRLTSGTVHFNVHTLLRIGWGESPDCVFDVRNVDTYYREFARVYGIYLFCSYFELFPWLCTDANQVALIDELRHGLRLSGYWPEMVTFEELNVKRPPLGILELMARALEARAEKHALYKENP